MSHVSWRADRLPPPYRPTFNPYYGNAPRFARRRRFGTSPTELLHLLVAVGVLTTAIVLWMERVLRDTNAFQGFRDLTLVGRIVVALGIAVTGFALHEIGHKITAQHYGHWSEFRFSLSGLALTLIMSYLGILFGAPGATWHTATSPRDNGKISAAGPLVNLFIALVAVPFTSQFQASQFSVIADGILLFNTILAGFNLVPLGPLDGRKVLRWNPFVYAILLGLVVLLIIYANPFSTFLGS